MSECRLGPAATEVMLRTTDELVGGLPTVECSGCHYQADHFFWYEDASYARRRLRFCPNCNAPILGVFVK